MRILGIDPGLTRCGVGVVDVFEDRSARIVDVQVVRTSPTDELHHRLLAVGDGIDELVARHGPAVVAIERVFAQDNLSTVMGVAQITGVALAGAARRGLDVAMHTPSEVKAAVTGYGQADKKQVATMVARILGLDELPTPADASDALALAICAGWRAGLSRAGIAGTPAPASRAAAASAVAGAAGPTAAQAAWLAAERAQRGRR
ncbi:Crossover junction endodeoxyribonuclease RuvC [Clavibacter michiganensis]|uniref:Crossover junction endodeoxyribonuclease RuvC n=1 Tax=Clavibacter michiganensis TaxID=28447 RepID=A0A251Y5G9_9MICO|nr:crossover junction endodeoxyribonuclease RuvC [Clavibacter michiganensis]OUE19526.1 Crossover junction endodeoxyribonuclease RuvC [Clavibacter michiganensis]